MSQVFPLTAYMLKKNENQEYLVTIPDSIVWWIKYPWMKEEQHRLSACILLCQSDNRVLSDKTVFSL